MTHRFKVPDMTCGHCAARITNTVRGVDPDARVSVELESRLVRIDGDFTRDDYAAAILDAGYTPGEAS